MSREEELLRLYINQHSQQIGRIKYDIKQLENEIESLEEERRECKATLKRIQEYHAK